MYGLHKSHKNQVHLLGIVAKTLWTQYFFFSLPSFFSLDFNSFLYSLYIWNVLFLASEISFLKQTDMNYAQATSSEKIANRIKWFLTFFSSLFSLLGVIRFISKYDTVWCGANTTFRAFGFLQQKNEQTLYSVHECESVVLVCTTWIAIQLDIPAIPYLSSVHISHVHKVENAEC